MRPYPTPVGQYMKGLVMFLVDIYTTIEGCAILIYIKLKEDGSEEGASLHGKQVV